MPAFLPAAQERDFQTRANIAADWEPIKKLQLTGRYRIALQENSTEFRRSMFSLGASYDLKKWVRVGGEYRFYTSFNRDFHRFLLLTRLEKGFQKWNFRYRLQYQQSQDYFDQEYLAFERAPVRVFRNKAQASYSYSRKIGLYAYAESFSRYEHREFNWYRMRYGAGLDYLYKRKHTVGAEFFVNDEFNINAPKDQYTLELNYSYHFTKKKKKKKKSDSAVGTEPTNTDEK